MSRRGAAAVSALVSVIIALGVGFGVAVADEKPSPGGGDTCTVNGDHNVVVAPFCGANFAPAPTPPTTSAAGPPVVTISSRPQTPIICQIRPTSPECQRPTGPQPLETVPGPDGPLTDD